jgi:hypothetical protein
VRVRSGRADEDCIASEQFRGVTARGGDRYSAFPSQRTTLRFTVLQSIDSRGQHASRDRL